MNTPAEVAVNYLKVGVGKVELKVVKMFLLSLMAGAFIALAGVAAASASATVAAPSIAKLVSALIFPAGLMMVVLAGSELFTGNCLLVMPLLSKKIRMMQMLRSWVIVYIGNFVGSILVAATMAYSHQLSAFSGSLLTSTFTTAIAKCSLTFGDAFLKGIACNFLVCIAVWITMSAKTVVGKIVGLYFPIMAFVVSGFEHSIANMFYGPVGLIAKGMPEYASAALEAGIDLSGLSWGGFLVHNLVPVTLGNIVGGVIVGVVYWCVYVQGKKENA